MIIKTASLSPSTTCLVGVTAKEADIRELDSWRKALAVTENGFGSQHLPGSSQLHVMAVPGHLIPSSELCGHQTNMVHMCGYSKHA